jgi:hypothetical protein
VKFEIRGDPESWLVGASCPFYFHRDIPRCVVTRLALTATRDVFDGPVERDEVAAHDCHGRIPQSCPWIANLWAPPAAPSQQAPSLEIIHSDVHVQVDHRPSGGCDVLMIPTTRMGRFDRMGQDPWWGPQTSAAVAADVAMFEMPLDSDRCIETRAPGTGYSFIVHVPIFDDVSMGGISLAALDHAFSIASDAGVASIEVRPMCIVTPSGTLPGVDECMTAVDESFDRVRRAGGLTSCSFLWKVVPEFDH